MSTTVRRATVDDVPALQIVRRQSVESNFTDVYDRNRFADLVAYDSRDLKHWIEAENFSVMMMETDITPVSYGACDRDNGTITALYTAPEYEGEGRATELLQRMEEILIDSGHETAEVTVPLPGFSFFQDRGYEVIEEAKWNSLEARLCRKDITC